MEITELNFEKEFPLICKSVEEASFIAFDFEFTGVKTNNSHETNKFDSLEDKYQKMRHNCQNFSVLQMGLTCLKWSQEKKTYIASIFTFYLKKPKKTNGSLIMLAQVDSMTFLSKNSYDFNKTFELGIDYERLYEKPPIDDKKDRKVFFSMSQENKKLYECLINLIEDFINSDTKSLVVDFQNNTLLKYFYRMYNGSDTTFSNAFNFEPHKDKDKSFSLKLIKKKGAKTFDDKEESDKNQKNAKAKPDKFKSPQSKPEPRPRLVSLVEIIIKKKIPIIGHYPVLDLGFFFDHFVDELPENYPEYIKRMEELFPFIFDTKVIAESFNGTVKTYVEGFYNDLFNNSNKLKPFHNVMISQEANFPKLQSQKNQKLHDAGYDSYITGCAFVAMYYKMVAEKVKDADLTEKILRSQVDLEKLKPFLYNFFGGMNFLKDKQLAPNEINHNKKYVDRTFAVTIIDSKCTSADIEQVFTEYADIKVHMLSKTYCYVKIKDRASNYKDLPIEEIRKKIAEEGKRFKVDLYVDRIRFKAKKIEPEEIY